jgi:hypothetical protein
MKIIKVPFIISISILIIGMGFVYMHFAHLNTQVILHFNSLKGPDYVGSAQDVFFIVLSGLGIVTLNYLLSRAISKKEQFLPLILSFSSILISVLILISVFVIIANN